MMSNQSGYDRTAAGRSSTVHRCPVCGANYSSLFSVQRHLGIKHMLDVTGRIITEERQTYLRHQSDRRYVRNGERKSDSQSVETEIESIRLPQQALSAARASYIEPAKESRKFILVDPVMLDEIYNNVKSMNNLKSDQKTYEEEEDFDDDDVVKNSAVSPVCMRSQRHVQTSIRAQRQPRKTTSSPSLHWSCY
jgi:hypothetical protein